MPEVNWRCHGVKPDKEREFKYSFRRMQLKYLEHTLKNSLPGVEVEWNINEIFVTLDKAHSSIEIVGLHETWTAEDFREFERKTVNTLKEYV